MESLKVRRVKTDLIMYYKVINGLNDLNPSDFFVFASNLSLSTRGHSLKLVKRPYNTNSWNNCFSNRVINCWNSLPIQMTLSMPLLLWVLNINSIA